MYSLKKRAKSFRLSSWFFLKLLRTMMIDQSGKLPLPQADVAVQITFIDVHTKAIGILHHATTVSVAELLTQVEIEIKNQIFHK